MAEATDRSALRSSDAGRADRPAGPPAPPGDQPTSRGGQPASRAASRGDLAASPDGQPASRAALGAASRTSRAGRVQWPVEPPVRSRPDWREGLSLAADLALIGITVTVACAPVLTAGAAVRTGSVAVRHVVDGERVPPVVDLWRVFRRALVPGAVATVGVLAAAALLAVDVAALSSGRVPGGTFALVATVVVAAALAAVAALTTVRLGREPGDTWRAASKWAFATARQAPGATVAAAGVLTLATVIVALVPVTAPLLVGFGLFALHVVVRRFAG